MKTNGNSNQDSAQGRRTLGVPAIIGLALALTLPAAAAEVTFNATAEAPSDNLFIYRMEQPTLSPAEAASKLGSATFAAGHEMLPVTSFRMIEDRLAYADDTLQLSIREDGTELYFTDFPALKLAEPTGPLPGEKEALTRTWDFLRMSGLMPANAGELKVDHVGGIMQASADPLTTYEPEQKAVVVYLYRELDGLRVMNYGSSITLTFGDGPGLVGLQYHWREVASRQPVERSLAVSTASIPELIKTDVSRVFAADARITVESIELVLHDNGGEYIQPAYCYKGTCLAVNGGTAVPVLGYVPAITGAPEAVHHPGCSPDRPAFFGQAQK
jgi:hypothetical protein